jgi:hypothetical protein
VEHVREHLFVVVLFQVQLQVEIDIFLVNLDGIWRRLEEVAEKV